MHSCLISIDASTLDARHGLAAWPWGSPSITRRACAGHTTSPSPATHYFYPHQPRLSPRPSIHSSTLHTSASSLYSPLDIPHASVVQEYSQLDVLHAPASSQHSQLSIPSSVFTDQHSRLRRAPPAAARPRAACQHRRMPTRAEYGYGARVVRGGGRGRGGDGGRGGGGTERIPEGQGKGGERRVRRGEGRASPCLYRRVALASAAHACLNKEKGGKRLLCTGSEHRRGAQFGAVYIGVQCCVPSRRRFASRLVCGSASAGRGGVHQATAPAVS
jgi:hypothetical protein